MTMQRDPHSPSTFCILTLGCKINQYESRAIREAWERHGLVSCDTPADADVVVINSCAVTVSAVRDVRSAVRRTRLASPKARIIVTGCAAQIEDTGIHELEEIDLLVPQQDKSALLSGILNSPPASVPRGYGDFTISGFERARPVVKVQDGCSHGCAYCIVPMTRGKSVSRPAAEVVAETARLFEAGYCEVTLSGINLRHFGRDLPGRPDLWDLVRELEENLADNWEGRARLRLSSLDPAQLTEKALEVLAASRLVCPHLHLSLQSLCPSVLRRMNRGHYHPEQVFDFLERYARIQPVFGLGADFICGFPGESDQDFSETLAAAEGLGLTYAHVFPYSRRPRTAAAQMPGQVPAKEKKDRAKALRELAAAKRTAFVHRLAGLDKVVVAVETSGSGTCEYYTDCVFDAPGSLRSHLAQARPVAAGPKGLHVEFVPQAS